MTVLDILAVGTLDRSESGEILEAHSTSTLIRSGDSLIVVDTSSNYMRPALKGSFRELGIFAKDVDTVVITHWHHDHTDNLDLFPNAEIYAWDGPAAESNHRNLNIVRGVGALRRCLAGAHARTHHGFHFGLRGR